MILDPQSTIKASTIEVSALTHHITGIAQVIQPALGSMISRVGVSGCIKFSEAYECDPPFGENKRIAIGNSQRLQIYSNARINKVPARGPG